MEQAEQVLFLAWQSLANHRAALARSALAARVFECDARVMHVLIADEFLTVTVGEGEWDDNGLRETVSATIDAFFEANPCGSVVREEPEEMSPSAASEVDSEIVQEIKMLLEKHIKPFVQADGGDVEFAGYQEGVVSLRMVGACASCPSSTVTAKFMIRNLLHHYIPEVTDVESLDEPEVGEDWIG